MRPRFITMQRSANSSAIRLFCSARYMGDGVLAYFGYALSQEEAVDQLLRSREEIETTFLLGVIAELRLARGELDHSRRILRRAEEIAQQRNGEMFYMAELMRLRGLLASRENPDDPESAGRYFEKELSLAKKQHAESWRQRIESSRRKLGVLNRGRRIHRWGL